MKKTILISQKDLNTIRSGVPRLVLAELSYFKELGHDAYAVAERIKQDAIETAGGIAYKTFRWPISGFFRRKFYNRRVQAAIKKLKPDLVIGHGDIIEQDILFIHNCVHLAHQTINGRPLPTDHQMGLIHSEILNTGKFKALVCNSHMMKNDLSTRFNLEDKKIFVHYPELNTEKFGTNREDIRAEYDIAAGTITIGLITSGNFKKRNVKLLLETIAKMKTDKKVHILIAGKDKAAPFEEILTNCPYPVTFLAPTDAVHTYYNSCDIFVLPAHIEEFGMSVLEAMACYKPVIVSHMVGSSEILEGKSKDFILKDLDVASLQSMLLELINDAELREELGRLNHEVALKYSSKMQNDKFGEVLKEVGFSL